MTTLLKLNLINSPVNLYAQLGKIVEDDLKSNEARFARDVMHQLLNGLSESSALKIIKEFVYDKPVKLIDVLQTGKCLVFDYEQDCFEILGKIDNEYVFKSGLNKNIGTMKVFGLTNDSLVKRIF